MQPANFSHKFLKKKRYIFSDKITHQNVTAFLKFAESTLFVNVLLFLFVRSLDKLSSSFYTKQPHENKISKTTQRKDADFKDANFNIEIFCPELESNLIGLVLKFQL